MISLSIALLASAFHSTRSSLQSNKWYQMLKEPQLTILYLEIFTLAARSVREITWAVTGEILWHSKPHISPAKPHCKSRDDSPGPGSQPASLEISDLIAGLQVRLGWCQPWIVCTVNHRATLSSSTCSYRGRREEGGTTGTEEHGRVSSFHSNHRTLSEETLETEKW